MKTHIDQKQAKQEYRFVDQKRVEIAISYMQQANITIRMTSEMFGISKSTLHRYIQKMPAQPSKECDNSLESLDTPSRSLEVQNYSLEELPIMDFAFFEEL
ncbi:Sporulation_stage III [Hexamita inflata]|nr:Sporulation stage III [Hexamita inflata]